MGTRLQQCNTRDYGVSKQVRCKKLYLLCHYRQQHTVHNITYVVIRTVIVQIKTLTLHK